MTDHITLVQNSFQRLLEIDPAHDFVNDFYSELILRDARIKTLFKHTNWNQQQNKFLLAVVMIVENLESPGTYQSTLKSLGEDHLQKYGVTRDMLPTFKNALLKTLRNKIPDEFTEEVEAGWSDAIDQVFMLMFS